MISKRGCWTCKDRRISCDRAAPVCFKCSKSKRTCSGYGMRLSWSRPQNQKRGLVECTSHKTRHNPVKLRIRHWVNVCSTDIRLHLLAANSDGKARGLISRENLVIPNIAEPLSSIKKKVDVGDMELLLYFESVVSEILPMLGSDRKRIRQFLIRVALSNRSQASQAVFLALLALSSYHRGDNLIFAAQMKYSAIQTLLEATGPVMDACTAIEHIAAGIVLCITEMQRMPDSCTGWIGHICGVKEVINAVQQEEYSINSDAAAILGWVYYFDALAHFGLRHWRTESIQSTALELGFNADGSQDCAIQYIIARSSFALEIPIISTYAHPLVKLLSNVFETLLYSSDPVYHTIEYQESLDELTSRLETFSVTLEKDGKLEEESQTLELTRLAALIYLERVSRNFSGQSSRLDSWTRAGNSLLVGLNTCPCPFAVFIFGCEARKDEHRLTILDFFTRMEEKPYIKSLLELKGLIQSAWIQHDLRDDGGLEYIHMLNLVLSSRNVVPSFMHVQAVLSCSRWKKRGKDSTDWYDMHGASRIYGVRERVRFE